MREGGRGEGGGPARNMLHLYHTECGIVGSHIHRGGMVYMTTWCMQ